MRLQRRRHAPTRIPVGGPIKKVSREEFVQWWHPDRIGAKSKVPDPIFMKKLAELDENVDVTWSPVHQRWILWLRASTVKNIFHPGWKLLFVVEDAEHNFVPLDERSLARLYSASMKKWGTAKHYFDHVEKTMREEQERASAQTRQDTMDEAMETFEHSQIKNINSGSNFSTYHA